jgi:hypothetical protein
VPRSSAGVAKFNAGLTGESSGTAAILDLEWTRAMNW